MCCFTSEVSFLATGKHGSKSRSWKFPSHCGSLGEHWKSEMETKSRREANGCGRMLSKKAQEVSFGVRFLHLKLNVFWRRSSRPLLRIRCWCMAGPKTGPSRRHRIQPAEGRVLDPGERNVFQKGRKVDPLEIKSSPSWRVQFRSFLTPSLWQIC